MTETSGWDDILEPGETILWQGQPVPDIMWRDMVSGRLPIGIIFTGFSTVWISLAVWMATSIEAPLLMRLLFPTFGLPFLAIGLYMLVGHVVWDAIVRRGTWYTLSDRHAFVATEILGQRKLDIHPIAHMTELALHDGVPGDVIFGSVTHTRPPRSPGPHRSRNRLAGSTTVKTGFFRIGEARRVWRMIRERQAALAAATRDMQEDGRP